MGKNMWPNNRWGENPRDDYSWQENEEQHKYDWLKKIIIAGIIFIIVYCAHLSDTTVGRMMDEQIRYTLSFQTDFNYAIDQIVSKAPTMIDLSVLKKVQMAVSKPADPLLYMSRPVNGKVISSFGWRVHPVSKQESMHDGIDMEAPLGANVKAVAPGTVKLITESAQYGKTLILEHSKDVDTVYGCLGEILVRQGELISQGQIIAKVGKTGMVSTPQLYFELREKGKAIDPVPRMKGDFPEKEGK